MVKILHKIQQTKMHQDAPNRLSTMNKQLYIKYHVI